MGLFSGSDNAAVLAQLARVERKLDAIIANLGISVPEENWMDEVRAMVAAGQMIAAIKMYRERTGAGLKEAKEAVERGV
jgi:ribosomal protein L7/L12